MTTIRPATDADLDRYFDLSVQAFNLPPSDRERWKEIAIPANIRLAEDDGGIRAGLRTLPFAHFFGGRAVPAAGVAGVAVAAEARGKGLGTALMEESLRELRARGVAISSLYPATAPIYRRCGYGFGGIRTYWQANLRAVPDRAEAEVEPFDESAFEEVDAAYRAIAATTNGLLERDRWWWDNRVWRPHDASSAIYRYLVRERGAVTGWVQYSPQKSRDDWRWTMSCRDLFWTTPGAARALLAVAAMHRSTARALGWYGPPTEPLGDLTGEDACELEHRFRWMIRLLDVPGAIEARGYQPLVEAAVTIAARDPLFDANQGPWRIEVSGGRAKVVPAGEAEASGDVETWASVWSGLLRARDAVRTGGITATERALEALEAIFAGPLPWLADFY